MMKNIDRVRAQALITNFRYSLIKDINRILKIIFGLILFSVVVLFALKSSLTEMPLKYTPVNDDGQELRLLRMGDSPWPSLSRDAEELKIIKFVKDCIERYYSTDTLNYIGDFQRVSGCYSKNTYVALGDVLVKKGYLKLLKNREVWQGDLLAKNAKIETTLQGNRKTWIINAPFRLTRYTIDGEKYLNRNVRIRVSRMNSLEFNDSIAITQVLLNDG
tara:strand:+ start:42 stop:695 length:654 start_codon:yes stop_codon:yes gene_type:complete